MRTSLLPQLHVFLEVARKNSFSGAARELGVSTSAVSQAVRQLEEELGVTLLTRTTRSVALTTAGSRLVDTAGPALSQASAALAEVGASPDETIGRLRLNVPRVVARTVLGRVLPVFRARHPRIDVEIVVDDRFVDIVAEGYDAGIRLTEAIERDMVQVRITPPFRFVIVASPGYLTKHGVPERPEDLLKHECITFRSQTNGSLYAWEFERGRRQWRIPVRSGVVVTTDSDLVLSLVEQGVGLAYAVEPYVAERVRAGTLSLVLEDYAPSVPGFFLYYPSRSKSSPALRHFVECTKEVFKGK